MAQPPKGQDDGLPEFRSRRKARKHGASGAAHDQGGAWKPGRRGTALDQEILPEFPPELRQHLLLELLAVRTSRSRKDEQARSPGARALPCRERDFGPGPG